MSKIEEIYVRINQEIGQEAEVLAHTMITAFSRGFSLDPPGQVRTVEAENRVKDFLIERVQIDKIRFSLSDERPGFLYHSNETNSDLVLGMGESDPLMSLLKEIVILYHREIVASRDKDWFKSHLGLYEHENQIDVSIADITKIVYWGLMGVSPPNEVN